MVLAVIGSRNFNDFRLLDDIMKDYFCEYKDNGFLWNGYIAKFSRFVSGGCDGADILAYEWCQKYNRDVRGYFPKIEIREFLPEWEKYGKKAGPLRNKLIIDSADVVLAFWDGESKGTKNALGLAKNQKKPTIIIYF